MIVPAKTETSDDELKRGIGKKRISWGFFILGIVVSLIGYVVYDFHINYYRVTGTGRKVFLYSEYPYQFVGLVVIIVGLIIISIWFAKKVYSMI